MPYLLPPPALGNRGGGGARRRRRFRRPGARGRLQGEGKGRGGPAGSIPDHSSGEGGPGWPGLDDRRQRAMVASDRCPSGAAMVKERGRSTSGPRGCQSLPLFGPRGRGKGSSAVAGGGNGERWRCRAVEGVGSGCGGLWCGEAERGPFYRAGKALEGRSAAVAGRRAVRGGVMALRPLARVGTRRRGRRGRGRGDATARAGRERRRRCCACTGRR
jgi:hypothetical protein